MIRHPLTLAAAIAGGFCLALGATGAGWPWLAAGAVFEAGAVALVWNRLRQPPLTRPLPAAPVSSRVVRIGGRDRIALAPQSITPVDGASR